MELSPTAQIFWYSQTGHSYSCALCGQCVALCPSKAITLEAGEIRFDEKLCLGCCGCLNICPQNAWRSSRFGPEYFNKGLHVPAMAEALERQVGQRPGENL